MAHKGEEMSDLIRIYHKHANAQSSFVRFVRQQYNYTLQRRARAFVSRVS